MFIQYYGNYLLKRKLLTTDQLKEILDLEDSAHVKLGILAIDAGYMKAEDVKKVNAMQMKVDKRFGELAVQEGYFTSQQLDELLARQNKSHLSISQVLVDKGYFSIEQIETIFEEFKRDSGLSAIEMEALINNDVDNLVSAFFNTDEKETGETYKKYASLFVKGIIRFINSNIKLEKAEQVNRYDYNCVTYQMISGKYNILAGFSSEKCNMLKFANKFGDVAQTELDDIAIDSLKEFINCQNGLFISEMSENNIELNLSTPDFKEGGAITTDKYLIRIPFTLAYGNFDLLIAEEPFSIR